MFPERFMASRPYGTSCYEKHGAWERSSVQERIKSAATFFLGVTILVLTLEYKQTTWPIPWLPIQKLFASQLYVHEFSAPKIYPLISFAAQMSFTDATRHQKEAFFALLAFVPGIHRSPVNSPHKGQWRATLMFSLICAWKNGWVNTREAGALRCHHAHYDVIVMWRGRKCNAFNHLLLARVEHVGHDSYVVTVCSDDNLMIWMRAETDSTSVWVERGK